MTVIQRQVRNAKHRLWLNRWLRQWGWWLLAATLAWTIAWLAARLFALHLPMAWAALAGLAVSLVGSLVCLAVTREQDPLAAAALDEAAGLKERVSTGLHVSQSTDDPFAQAVVADAQRAVTGLSARQFIRLRWPRSLSLSAMMLMIAMLSLTLKEFDLLGKKEARAANETQQAALNRVRSAVAKPVSAIQKIAESNPDPTIDKEIKALQDAMKKDGDPNVVRREAAKRLDRLEDALKSKADADRFKALGETKKRLKQMGESADPKGELSKLIEAMSSGDFKEAQEQIKKVQDQLAKHARDPKADPEKVAQMKKQLEELSNKLQKAAEDKQSEREMKNAGLSEKDIQRVLDTLAKKDPQQLEKLAKEMAERLKEKGMTKEQMEKLLNKIQERQQAAKQCEKMAEKMSGAAKQLEKGDAEAAKDQLGEAEQMLSEMEQMEQTMNELEGQMAQLDQARSDLNNEGDEEHEDDLQCKQCNGTGFRQDGSPCPHCKGTGQGPGGRGRGMGPRERDDNVQVGFENKKEKTLQNKNGSIISQQFVKGRPLKNQSETELFDAAKAAEVDATDSLDRERIPRIYRKGVRTYFDRLGDQFKSSGTTQPASSQPASGQ